MKYGISYRFDCPICNSKAYLKQLNEEPKDFKMYEMKGLGRGKGFSYIPQPIDIEFRDLYQSRIVEGINKIITAKGVSKKYFNKYISWPDPLKRQWHSPNKEK